MYELTKRELKILATYIEFGTCVKAAANMRPRKLNPQTVKNALYLMRIKARVSTNGQLVYEYGEQLRRYRRTAA